MTSFQDIDEEVGSLQKQVSSKKDQILHNELKLKAIKDLTNKNNIKIKHNKDNMKDLEKEANNILSFIKDFDEKERQMLRSSDEKDTKGSLNAEYFKIKAQIHEKTARMQQELWAQTRALERINMSIMMKSSKREDLVRKINDLEHKMKAANENQKSETQLIQDSKNELKETQVKSQYLEKKLTQLNVDIEQEERQAILLKGEIVSLEEDKELKREERRIKEALEDLRKHQKGYHGFFYELVHPIQSKYEIAIKVALQGALKLLVVDSVDVAQKVDEYLTEKGLYLDCLILEKVPTNTNNNIHSKRKKLEGRGHMIADVVDWDKGIKDLENALKYFCGDKVVCLDTELKESLYLSNKGFKRVITLDGTSLTNGMFEGGHQSNIFDKTLGSAKQDRVMKEKNQALSKVTESLAKFKTEKLNLEGEIKKVKSDTITKETQIRLMEDATTNMLNHQTDKEQTIIKFKKEIDMIEAELKTLHTERKAFNKQVNGLQKEIGQIEGEEFKGFIKKAKINNISEFEGANIKEFEENSRLKQQYVDSLNHIKHQIEKLGIEQCIKANELLEKEEQSVQNSIDELKGSLEKLEEQMGDKSQLKSEAEKDYTEFQKKKDKSENEMRKDEDQLCLFRRRIQELGKNLQEVKYELKSNYISLLKKLVLLEAITDKKAEKLSEKINLDLDVEQLLTKFEDFDIDYSSLDIDDKTATEHQVAKYVEQLGNQLKEKEKAIEDFERVSMLAPECKKEIKQLSEKMKDLKDDYEKEGEEGKSTTDRLKEVKRLRNDTMNELIKTLNEKLSPIYQNLTKKDEFIFGTAHLMIEDKMNPFNGSINFIPNPPGKRSIYDIQQLSSGEKTMAVLSFVFALVKYWDLPFLILDEADSHLDDSHINRIIEYIWRYLNKQCVFVSHKEKTIESADSLVGVTFDVNDKTSQAFSLDLRNCA